MSRRYFGTDGIRGRANSTAMTPELAMRVGMAAGRHFTSGKRGCRAVVGKDTRLSGYMLEAALVAGFTAAGMDVLQLGPMPTPAVAMLTRSMRADLGVMISASHNPFEDNGIKLFGPDGYKLSDVSELEIESLIEADVVRLLAPTEAIGRAKRVASPRERYIEHAKRALPTQKTLSGLRIALDCANGAAYEVAPLALWELGAEVIAISTEPNGTNINESCGSTAPQKLIAKTLEIRADIGIALDGDGDRVLIVDERGNVVDGDQIIALIAELWHRRGLLKGGAVVGTVMSNLGLERFIGGMGLELVRTKVGDRYVVEEMRRRQCNVGGEQSGHLVLSDYSTTGDGLVSALQVLAAMVESGKRASEICRCFAPLPQLTENVPCRDPGVLERDGVRSAIEGAREILSEAGRLVVRRSGTEPLVRIMAEGEDRAVVELAVRTVKDELLRLAA
ncbi:MAG: phosphoglucosamine mutase [Hyphomicrobiaceae bacterium]